MIYYNSNTQMGGGEEREMRCPSRTGNNLGHHQSLNEPLCPALFIHTNYSFKFSVVHRELIVYIWFSLQPYKLERFV